MAQNFIKQLIDELQTCFWSIVRSGFLELSEKLSLQFIKELIRMRAKMFSCGLMQFKINNFDDCLCSAFLRFEMIVCIKCLSQA